MAKITKTYWGIAVTRRKNWEYYTKIGGRWFIAVAPNGLPFVCDTRREAREYADKGETAVKLHTTIEEA